MSTIPIGVSASQNLRGVTARKTTGVAKSAHSPWVPVGDRPGHPGAE